MSSYSLLILVLGVGFFTRNLYSTFSSAGLYLPIEKYGFGTTRRLRMCKSQLIRKVTILLDLSGCSRRDYYAFFIRHSQRRFNSVI